MATYLPTSLFVMASWISFLIPPEMVPGRMALLVTLLLVQVNIFLQVAANAPTSPDLSSISMWNISCIFMVRGILLRLPLIIIVLTSKR